MTKKLFNTFNKSFKGPFLFWTASMVANVFNWLYNLNAGRILSKEEFGVLSVYLSILALLFVPAGALTTTVARFTAYYSEKGELQKYFHFFRQYWWFSWVLGILSLVVFLLLINPISSFFGIHAHFLTFIFSLVLIPLFLLSFEKGALLGQLAFVWIGLLLVFESIIKFVFLFFSKDLPFAPLTLAVVSLPISAFLAWFISMLISRSIYPVPQNTSEKKNKDIFDSYKFLSNTFFASLGTVLIYSLDVLLVKHYFNASDAGIYSTLSLLGKILYFGAGSVIGIMVPITTRSIAKNPENRTPLLVAFSLVAAAGSVVLASYIFIPELVVSLLLTKKALVTLPYLTQYASAIFLLVLATCISSFNIAKKNFTPARIIILFAILQAALISFYHNSLGQVVNIIFGTSAGLFTSLIILEFLNLRTFKTNIQSFFDLFSSSNEVRLNNSRKRILIFNWRDVKHIYSGGAEVYIQQVASNLVKRNFEVTIFTSNDQKSKRYETVDGVRIIRRGGFVTVYIWAFLYYILKFRNKFDAILDSENGIPFFTPFYIKKPIVLLVHHVHQDVFLKLLVPPFSWIANFLETFLMPKAYKNSQVIAVSRSTAEELKKNLNIHVNNVIENGVDTKTFSKTKKVKYPLISYVGRLKKYKSIGILINSFQKLVQDFPTAKLVIAGEGDYRKNLEEQVLSMKIKSSVKFLGKITEEEKIDLLGKSWVMVQPSYQEGFGITCLEANAAYTPVLASRVAGLKDAVKEGDSGYLFEYGDSVELYRRLKDLTENSRKRARLSKKARTWSERFSWENQAAKMEVLLDQIIQRNNKTQKSIRFAKAGLSVTNFLSLPNFLKRGV
jgi:glycosyltransferase involved in cell wall biosynthesis/O-antigen/teichoic acid export membrane protein